jgi:hypothetical protein
MLFSHQVLHALQTQVAAAARKFASGTLLLQGDVVPLLPAKLTQVDETTVQVAICEGR